MPANADRPRIDDGAAAWNAWRRAHPDHAPALGHADLAGRDLAGYDLRRAELTGASLRGCDLTGTDLGFAILRGAELREAVFDGTDLGSASLYEASLGGVDLRRARIQRTVFGKATAWDVDLRGMDLRLAFFQEAWLEGARLSGADLSDGHLDGAVLRRADLEGARLAGARMNRATLEQARLRGADLSRAQLSMAQLVGADLEDAVLERAVLTGANLLDARLCGARLVGADLRAAILVQADLSRADLSQAAVYGVSAWNLVLDGTRQDDLRIHVADDRFIGCDHIEVAQFVHLCINNPKIRDVIDTVTAKAVLILGNFGPARMPVLDQLRDALRRHDLVPILFDFDKPGSRDLTETVSLLAHMSRFVIADLTDARSLPQELKAIVPQLPSVPVQPILLASQRGYAMFEHIARYPWVRPTFHYADAAELLASLETKLLAPLLHDSGAAVDAGAPDCPVCRTALPAHARFCPGCGRATAGSAAAAPGARS